MLDVNAIEPEYEPAGEAMTPAEIEHMNRHLNLDVLPLNEPEPEAPSEPEPDGEPEPADEKQREEMQLVDQRESLLMQADKLQVADAATYERAAELARTFAGWIKQAEAHFDPDIEAAHKLHKSLCDKRSAFVQPLKDALDKMKARAAGWWRGEEEKRQAEQRRREEADRVARDAERQRLQNEAKAKAATGDLEAATDLMQEAKAVDAAPPPPQPPSSAPKVRGMTHKENWTYRVTDKQKLVAAIAGVPSMFAVVDTRIAALTAMEERTAVVTAILEVLTELRNDMAQASPAISLEAVQENAIYLRGRAKTDKNTLEWGKYGVHIYDAGTTAVRA